MPRPRPPAVSSSSLLAVVVLAAAPALAQAPAYREIDFTLWSKEFRHHSEGGNAGESDSQPLEWAGNTFRLHYRPTKKPPAMRRESKVAGRLSADGRRVESVEIDNTFWYENLDRRDMVARTIIKARDLPLRPGRQPGELVAEVSGAELPRALFEVKWLHSHWGNKGLDYFQPEPRFQIRFARAPGSTGVVLKGRVTTPDEFGWKPGVSLPLVGVPVRLLKDDRVLASTFTDETGGYTLQAPTGQAVSLRVELQHVDAAGPRFQVVHDVDADPVWMRTAPFVPTVPGKDAAGKDLPSTMDVSFATAKGVVSDSRYDQQLADVAYAFVSARLAWKEAASLGLELGLGLPLEIRVFSSESVGAPVPMTNGEGPAEASITLPPEYSVRKKRLREGVVWHEFGHYVMASTFSHLYPHDAGGVFHGGYTNPTTNDSWGEGFASFFALLVNVQQNHSRRPVVDVNGWVYDFSARWAMPWSQDGGVSQEEAAVASLLWDLEDEVVLLRVHEASNTALDAQNVAFATILTDEKPARHFKDWVSVDPRVLLGILTSAAGADDAPAAAPPGYGHIFDVHQLHAALRARGVGVEKREGEPLDALDELFVGHGFFADVAPPDLYWEEGEAVGFTANGAWLRTGPLELPARPERRYSPVIPNSYVEYEVRDQGGDAVPVQRFAVEAHYSPPDEGHDYSFEAWASSPGRLYVVCPQPPVAVTYRIRPLVDGARAVSTLDLGCDRYWQEKRKQPRNSFLKHTFQVDRPRGLARLLPSAGGGHAILLLALAAAALGGAVLFLGGIALYVHGRRAAPEPAARSAAAAQRAWWLDVASPDGTSMRLPLTHGSLRIGRTEDNDLVLAQPDVSTHHAVLEVSGDRLLLRDLGSRNGTFVAETRVASVELAAGDLVRIGASWLRVGRTDGAW